MNSLNNTFSNKDSAMKHSHTSRNLATALFSLVTIALLGACADSTVAPTTEAAFKAPAAFSRVLGIKVFRATGANGATQRIGDQLINIPANAICDLTSSYGSGEWDKPCTPMKGSVLITATMLEDRDGNPYVDFQPALRFVPTKEVVLYLKSGKSERATEFNIEYCNNLGVCYDESKTDATLKTFRVGKSSILGRRIKHFSGYSLAAGLACAGSLTDDGLGMMCEGAGSVSRRSGYMLASGLADNKDESSDIDKEVRTPRKWER